MPKSKFAREPNKDGTWTLFWICDGELGGELGETGIASEPKDPDNHETWRAETAARPFAMSGGRKYHGFAFKDKQAAVAAQKAADAAIRNAPMEEWEAKALAAGWKPPKEWKKG